MQLLKNGLIICKYTGGGYKNKGVDMIIISKNKEHLINLRNVTEIYKGADECTIKVNFKNGTGTQIDRYNSKTDTNMAFEMLCDAIGKQEKFVMPNDEQVKARIISKPINTPNNYNGRKQKGHGAS